MTWLIIAIAAYFLNAIATVIDKTLLKKQIPHPVVYVFYIAALGIVLMLLIIPFGIKFLTPTNTIVALIAGAVWIWGLILMLYTLKREEASRVAPMIGGLTPLFILILAWYILGEKLNCNQYAGFAFIMAGTFLISIDFQKHGALSWLKKKLGFKTKLALPQLRKSLLAGIPAAILFAISDVLNKFVYTTTDFLSGFVWTRAGSLLAVLALLLIPVYRQLIIKDIKKNKKNKKQANKTGAKFILGQICGGSSAILVQYAIFLGSVTLVKALQGIQYAFVFMFVILTTIFWPKFLKENLSKEIFFQKALSVIIIIIGLYFISIQ